LFVNGKPQPIDYFDMVDFKAPRPAPAVAPLQAASAPAPAAATPELRDRRLFLLLFDLVITRPGQLGEIERSRRAAMSMVDHALPGDLFSVAVVREEGIELAIPFLRDHDAIRRAILELAPTHAHDALGLSITGAERETAGGWGASSAGDAEGIGKRGEDPLPDIFAEANAAQQDLAARLAIDRIDNYAGLAARLRDLEGFKHVILFSEGFHADPERQFMAVKRMAEWFQSANVYLHAVDLTPIATGAADPKVQSAPSRAAGAFVSENIAMVADPYAASGKRAPVVPPSENDSLLWISNATGGSWIHWKNFFAPALDELSASYSAVYRLGFKPVAARKGHNDIDVKVKNLPPEATVSFRKGFNSTVPSKSAPDALLLADIIENDTPQSGTPPEVSVAGGRVDVVVPVMQLSKQYGAVEGAAVMLYVFDSKGIAVLSSEKTFAIPEHAAADRVIQQKVMLAPGNYVAKVLMRVGDSLAFAKEPFEIEADQPAQ
ncbi:MAG TPA: hypothetical protein VGJ82_05500, partial [Thermoanaerobaculia bacterium]